MKITITADVHFGKRGRTEDILFSQRAIREYNHKHGIRFCMVLGDLFHDRRGVSWDVIGQAHHFFDETRDKYGQEWIAFPGNHDMFLKNSFEHNALNAMKKVLTVFDDVTLLRVGDQRFRIIPFIHYEDVYMKVVDAVVKDPDTAKDDILLTHIGVKDASLNECFLLKYWGVVSFEEVPHRVYGGHFHCHQQVGDNFWYPGSPIPFDFAEGVVDHGFIVFDTETQTHEFVKLADCDKDHDLYPETGLPPGYHTIMGHMLETGEADWAIPGNNVRIALEGDPTREEMAAIREDLLGRGARSVAWMRLKEKEVELTSEESKRLSVARPDDLMGLWFDKDQPPDIDRELLLRLNKQVISEGNEKLVVEE